MSFRNFLFLFFVMLSLYTFASPKDSISTRYKDGTFVTYSQVAVNASDSISNRVIDRFVTQMCYDIDGLFTWGLKGMLLENEKDELLIFDFKTTKFNPSTSILRASGDIIVQNVTSIPNLFIDSKLTQKKYADGRREVVLELASPNPFLNDMVGVFTFHPRKLGKYGYYSLRTSIKFGWFFNLFITQKRYKSILEWRILKVMDNMRNESEKRQKKSVK
jgi:hypothetical protein